MLRRRERNTPTGNRTPVFWLRTRCPRPLDDGGLYQTESFNEHARQDSNLQPPVLETGALPIELRASVPASDPVLPHGQGQNRTADTTIFSRVLYQLSYLAACTPNYLASDQSHQYSNSPAKSPEATELPGRLHTELPGQ